MYGMLMLLMSVPGAVIVWAVGFGFMRPWYLGAALLLAIGMGNEWAQRGLVRHSSFGALAGALIAIALGGTVASLLWLPAYYVWGAGEWTFAGCLLVVLNGALAQARHAPNVEAV